MDRARARRQDRSMKPYGPPDRWPLDAKSAFELVARAVADIRRSSTRERDALLSYLLCAAWPTPGAQNQ